MKKSDAIELVCKHLKEWKPEVIKENTLRTDLGVVKVFEKPYTEINSTYNYSTWVVDCSNKTAVVYRGGEITGVVTLIGR